MAESEAPEAASVPKETTVSEDSPEKETVSKDTSIPGKLSNAKTKALERRQSEAQEPPWRVVARCTGLLLLAGSACTVSQLSLSPIYGTIPASTWHRSVQLQAALLSCVVYYIGSVEMPRTLEACLALQAWAGPALLHFVLAPRSTSLGPNRGPLAAELIVLFPVLLMIYSIISIRLSSIVRDDSWLLRAMPLIIPLAGQVTIYLSKFLLFIYSLNITDYRGEPLFTRWALETILLTFFALLYPSKLLLAVLPLAFFQFYSNPHAPFAHTTARLNSTLQREVDWTLRERMESTTGYLSVLESNHDAYRVLRCDHSLLGGNWLPTPERRKDGITVAEPIYPVFTMLEAVRLMRQPESEVESNSREYGKALVIGLGIGTAPKALALHGIRTTVIELDPGVTSLAQRWFDLPNNVTVQNEDALNWIKGALNQRKRPHFDYLIHDVFTGGAEPLALFDKSFLFLLSMVLELDGYAAVNYAGDLKDAHTIDVLETISSTFQDNCRVYRETPPPSSEEDGPDFANLVVFCCNSRPSDAPSPSWHFRATTEADFLGSVSRRQNIPPRNEVNMRALKKKRRSMKSSNETSAIDSQQESAEKHWRIMRKVLPPKVWELY